mgnify:CR=1 FL=1
MDLKRRELIALTGVLMIPEFLEGGTIKTSWQSAGPFYPDRMPKDTDNDLVLNGETAIRAGGQILNLHGVLGDSQSKPMGGSEIEIWQTDLNGVYIHSGSFGHSRRDPHFQGFGCCTTDSGGRFYFRTIIPVEYPGRTPHIHMKVLLLRKILLITQLYIEGHHLNASDFLYRAMSEAERELNSMKLSPVSNNGILQYKSSIRILV